MPEQSSVQRLNASDVPIQTVTVFTDRAEIVRSFSVSLHPGMNEVCVENIAGSIEQSSIRVDGTGPATIHEVKFETKQNKEGELDSDRAKTLATQLKDKEASVASLRDQKAICEKRMHALNEAADRLGQSSTSASGNRMLTFDAESESAIDRFFDFHERRLLECQVRMRSLTEATVEGEQEVNRLRMELDSVRFNRGASQCISIQLEVLPIAEVKQVQLDLSYQVYGAHWNPYYDLRARTDTAASQLQLNYFAKIQQSTGEDWNEVDLVLSTAQPALGGDLPKLGTTNVSLFKPQPAPPVRPMRKNMLFGAAPIPAAQQLCAYDVGEMAPMLHSEAQAQENALSTEFAVPVKKCIPSDNSEHKVTVVTRTVPALLRHHCVPKRTTNVFLVASVLNDSDFPLLPGPATVYVNGSMSANIYLHATAAGEPFECPLGVDRGIKVTYKPTHVYQSNIGVLSKSNSTATEQRILVRNTKRNEHVTVTLHESVPKSADEKVRVRLTAPDVKSAPTSHAHSVGDANGKLPPPPSVGAKLDDLNNLLWTEALAPGEEREFAVKWTIEYPLNESLHYHETNER